MSESRLTKYDTKQYLNYAKYPANVNVLAVTAAGVYNYETSHTEAPTMSDSVAVCREKMLGREIKLRRLRRS